MIDLISSSEKDMQEGSSFNEEEFYQRINYFVENEYSDFIKNGKGTETGRM